MKKVLHRLKSEAVYRPQLNPIAIGLLKFADSMHLYNRPFRYFTFVITLASSIKAGRTGYKRDMINGIFTILFCLLLVSCGGNGGSANRGAVSAGDETSAYPEGKKIYQQNCITCHNSDGQGTPGMYPPLAKSDFLLADKNRAIQQVLKGSSAEYLVNGATYTGMMPPQPLNDLEAAQVLNYVLHSWGNNGVVLTEADVKAVRDTLKLKN